MIAVVGLSHRTAPIEVREKLVLKDEQIPAFLQGLVQTPMVGEVLLVSTCNRVEVVAAGRGNQPNFQAAAEACASALMAHAPQARGHLYTHIGAAAVKHLLRVAASLDSLVLGEPQILGQVKQAYAQAKHAGTVGAILHRTLPRVLRAAKRVRTETAIGSGQVSVPSIAVELTQQIFSDLRNLPVLLVGSGEMAELVARLLRAAGAQITVIGRSPERVAELATAVGGHARLWAEMLPSLVEADVVITSTSASSAVIDYEMVMRARRPRRGRNQFFVDLAVPRDVDPRVGEIDGTFVYNIDDLSRAVAQSLKSRSQEAEIAEKIIAQEAAGYERWADAEQATPTIVALRGCLRYALEEELTRSLRGKLKHLGDEERAALTKMIEASLNRILHNPSMRLREAAARRGPSSLNLEQLTSALGELFGLDESDEATPSAHSTDDILCSESERAAEGPQL